MTECKRCGLCCRYILLETESMASETQRWINEHDNLFIFRKEDGNKQYLLIKSRCRNLRYKYTEAYCSIYEDRPDECKAAKCIRDTWIHEIIRIYELEKNR